MKKLGLLMIMAVFLLSACSGNTKSVSNKNGLNSKTETASVNSTSCEKGGLIYDNDEDPDWEIDLDGDCEGDIEFEGHENKTKHKPTDKTGVINKTNSKSTTPTVKKSTTPTVKKTTEKTTKTEPIKKQTNTLKKNTTKKSTTNSFTSKSSTSKKTKSSTKK